MAERRLVAPRVMAMEQECHGAGRLVLLFQVVVALYNGATFNQYYYGVCKRGAADVEKRQIGLVGGTLASAAAVAIVLAWRCMLCGNGREQARCTARC